MRESFADESWRGNYWYSPIILAHIKCPQDLSWVFLLESEARKIGFFGELKANLAFQILERLDLKSRRKIWQSLQDIPISIIDPKCYLKMHGIIPLNKFVYQVEDKGEKINIDRSQQFFKRFENSLQEILSREILTDSPLPDIEIAIENISNVFEIFSAKFDFYPEKTIDFLDVKNGKKKILGFVPKLRDGIRPTYTQPSTT